VSAITRWSTGVVVDSSANVGARAWVTSTSPKVIPVVDEKGVTISVTLLR